MSRLVPSSHVELVSLDRPFSNFRFAEERFSGSFPIRRLFSQARSRKCKTLVLEDVYPHGSVEAENVEIKEYYPDFQPLQLKRLSFWKETVTEIGEVDHLLSKDCVGYAILKLDQVPSKGYQRWTVFDSIMTRYEHHHNFTPCARTFSFRTGNKEFEITGVLYCQQNGLNKACAQVALRSICATYSGNIDLSYRVINQLAFQAGELFTPGTGLQSNQIRHVLDGLGIAYYDIDSLPSS